MLFIVAYIAFSAAWLGYLGTDESFKYVNATLRFWSIGFLISTNAMFVTIKAFYTEDEKIDTSSPSSSTKQSTITVEKKETTKVESPVNEKIDNKPDSK